MVFAKSASGSTETRSGEYRILVINVICLILLKTSSKGSLTPEGEQLRKLAIKVPSQMQGCIPLSEKDMILLRELLNHALACMNIDRR